MRWMMVALISLSAILLSLTPASADIICVICIGTDGGGSPVNSFCQNYDRVLRAQGESTKGIPLALRKRIAANETKYRCQCQGWSNPICAQTKAK